ncbi:MAG: GNAT family N-acetyltransferase [Alphaproteobacteria bacterium]|nr:GNAT family N-acetyltransferase [Alphaproteobacteria bacterium]
MIQIRLLTPVDLPLIEAHLARLDRRDRRLRFGASLSDDAIAAHCRKLPWAKSLMLGHVHAGTLRGMAMLAWGEGVARTDWRPDGELAVSVDRSHRRQGIGLALLQMVALAARNRWLRRLHIHYLAENAPMLALARKLHPMVLIDGADIDAVLHLAPPSQRTQAQEWLTAAAGWTDAFWDVYRWRPPQPEPANAPAVTSAAA